MTALLLLLGGCSPQGFTIRGSFDDPLQGTALITIYNQAAKRNDTLALSPIVDGKFTLTGAVDSLRQAHLSLQIAGKERNVETDSAGREYYVSRYWNSRFPLYLENASYTLHYGKWGVRVQGTETMNLVNQYMAIRQELEKANADLFPKIFYVRTGEQEMPNDEQERIKAERLSAIDEAIWTQTMELLNKHRNSPVTVYYLQNYMNSFPSSELKKAFARLGDEARNTPDGKNLEWYIREYIVEVKNTEPLFSATQKRNFAIDTGFQGGALTQFRYLAMLADDRVAGLRSDGSITLFDGTGKVTGEIKSGVEKALVFAVDETGNYYIIAKVLVDGKAPVTGAAECAVLNKAGRKIRSFRIEQTGSPSGSKVSGGTLYLADSGKRMVGAYDALTGEQKGEITNLRPCCGILDFTLSPGNRLIVANLAAFRADYFNADLEQVGAFGERGRLAHQFHGCCNPVNVACLSDGAILSVEKDPTRIKIYYNENEATVIEGVRELVKGCSYIPLAVDSKDNIYLASPTDGVVRCSVR